MQGVVVYEIRDEPGLCHCSSIIANGAGELLCVWYEGAYEGAPNTAIRASRRALSSSSWEPARDLFRYTGVPLGNPVLFSFDEGMLYLLFSVLFGESWKESVLFVSRSEDGGNTWSNPGLLYPRKGLMAKTRPLRLESGRILIPLYDEAGFYPVVLVVGEEGRWADAGLTAETMARDAAIQPALARLEDGSILMLCRSSRGRIWKSLSRNGGASWSICTSTGIPNPNSAIDLLALGEGRLLLAFNDSEKDRSCLSVALSEDEGSTWSFKREAVRGSGEYSYPSLLSDSAGHIHLTYTENRFRIMHRVIDVEQLMASPLEKPLITG
jgi:predicted neuraminidase